MEAHGLRVISEEPCGIREDTEHINSMLGERRRGSRGRSQSSSPQQNVLFRNSAQLDAWLVAATPIAMSV